MSRRGTASLFVPDDLLERALRASEVSPSECKRLFAAGRREEGVAVVADLLEAADVDTAQAELRRRGVAGNQHGLETVGEVARARRMESDGVQRALDLRFDLLRSSDSSTDDNLLSASPSLIFYTPLRHLEALALAPLPLNFHPASCGRGDVAGDKATSTRGPASEQTSSTLAIGIQLINILHQDRHTSLGKADSLLTVDRAVFRLGLRSLSATPPHPLHPRAARARHDPAVRHPSPLDRALSFPLLLHASVEPIHPDPIPPWSPDPAPPVELARGKELGTHHHRLLVESLPAGSLLVYSDGSMGDSGTVGAGIAGQQWNGRAKVVLEEGEEVEVEGWETRSKGLGQHQTVYVGELEGIRLALQAVLQTANAPPHILLSVDNTSALTHSTDPAPTSGQHLRLAIRRAFEQLQRTCVSTRLHLSWSPGHVGIVGNEVADVEAKEAVRAMESAEREREQRKARRAHLKSRMVFVPEMAELSSGSEDEGSEWEEAERGGRSASHLAKSTRLTQLSDNGSSGPGTDSQLPASTSALWTSHKQATRARWDDEWRRSSVGRQLFAASPLASRSAKYYNGLSRRQATLLCRLRTGTCALNKYRAKFDPSRDPLCSCGKDEDREHILLTCPLYDDARDSLLKHLRLRKLPTAGKLLGNPSYRDPLLDFLNRTGRFPRLSTLPEVEKKEKE